ncbi:hypothetical protein FQN54_001901 [Arachnomyces sp. PD_36]|nr:hypothetical protein FQN54_001901 [Arachnomyces sp. PD_36]
MSTSCKIPREPLIAVIGATGTGKSKLAVDLAVRYGGEIINGDAMQMYTGLPIITNQIPSEEREGIPHHLISCIGFQEEPWRVNNFKRNCLRVIGEIRSRGKLPILVGGTHYYTQAVLFNEAIIEDDHREGSDDKPPETSTSEKWPILDAPVEVMLEKLREVDPVMAERWHPKESRKIRRSLEIWCQTGRPASEVYEEQRRQRQAAATAAEQAITNESGTDTSPTSAPGQLRYPTLLFWLHAERQALQNRLEKRVDDMVQAGLFQEAQTLSNHLNDQESRGVAVDRTRGIWVSIGFKELEPYFSTKRRNSSTNEELEQARKMCIEAVKISTRQYAKQQVKWIKSKLWNALASVGMTHRLYLLDTSNPDEWSSTVREPSERVVDAFLTGDRACPEPKELSDLARETFDAKEKLGAPVDDGEMIQHITCDVCNKSMQAGVQWDSHIKSRSHKKVLRSIKRQAEIEAGFVRPREKKEDDTVIGE